jgi:hypothetical protein
MPVRPVSAWIKLATGDSLSGRFASNAARQALGAALFFATTLLLSSSLGAGGYATFFRNWNAGNLIAGVTEFGLFADIIRRFVLGESGRQVVRALWRRQALQFAAVAAGSWLASRFSDYDALFIFTVACSVAVGNVLAATALGRDLFRTFMVGELTHNCAFFLLVAAVAPLEPRTAGYLIAAAVVVKAIAYALLRGEAHARGQALEAAKPPPTSLVPGYAGRAYIHSLALMGTYRGFFVIIGFVLSPHNLERIALPWSLCDRALVLVQGICLVLQPRLIAGMVSKRARNLTYAGTMAVFIFVALAMSGMAGIWLRTRGQRADGVLGLSMLLCLAFVPHVLRVLRLSEFAAEGRFRTVFSSHIAATLAFVGVAVLAPLLGVNGIGFAAMLVVSVSLAGLVAFHETPA